MKTILVTGGAGYIGSHTVLQLLKQNYNVVAFDNLCNSSEISLQRVSKIANRHCSFVKGDVRDSISLTNLFSEHDIDAVVHFAALKAVGESSVKPYSYYDNNVSGTISLLKVMKQFNVSNFIFSSSATVYGEEAKVPYIETMKLGKPSSPYGMSKVMVEQIMQDAAISDIKFRAVSLRYFNPIGAHESGLIGEDPQGIPNNLLPFVAQVAVGRRDKLNIFGDDYPTSDGTCERDYIHVIDLADGHVAALDWLFSKPTFTGVEIFNLGTGTPVSVLDIINTFTKETSIDIPYEIAPRRPGDLPAFWANSDKAKNLLGWSCKRTLSDMMQDLWRWQSTNPNGYD